MSIGTLLERVLPGPIRRFIQIRSETRSLAALPVKFCAVEHLRTDVPDITALELTSEWSAVQEQLDKLKVGDKAGAVNPGDRRAIYYLTRALKPKSVLEVGTHLGASTAMFALALRDSGVTSPKLTTVDLLDVNGPEGAWVRLDSMQPSALIRALGTQFVQFVTSQSMAFLDTCTARFDLIFLDGGHEAATVYQEVPAALKLLNPNGLILLHDFYPNAQPLWRDGAVVAGPWLAIERIKSEGCKIKASPLGALPWATKLGSNVTSLACLIATPSA
jgi:predicted O-methyltransferase YrrM